jgi:RNAse (barnase) inhibitor barstar
MAFFTNNDFGRLDFQLLQSGSITMYWRGDVLAGDLKWFEEHEYRIDQFDCSEWDNKESLLLAIGEGLKFPDHFGQNLDALNDCLSDLEIPEASGRVIVLRDFDNVSDAMPAVAGVVLDILATNARRFLLFGRRLIIFIQSNNPRIAYASVGAESVGWNPKERLNADRGV